MKKRNRYERVRLDSGQHRRILLAAAILGAAAFVPVALRLWGLMIRDHDRYAALALKNQTRSTAVSGVRGAIYDRNMNVLAGSETVEDVYLDPHELKQSGADIPGLSAALGEILEKDPQWIMTQAADTPRLDRRTARTRVALRAALAAEVAKQ